MKNFSLRRAVLWIVLFAFSAIIHALVSGRVGRVIQPVTVTQPKEEPIEFVIKKPPPQQVVEQEKPPEEALKFDQKLEIEPPEILLAPKAVAPPPPDVTVALRAQSGGSGGGENVAGADALQISNGLDVGAVSATPGAGFGGFKTGIGNGLGDGTARFAAYVAGLREAGLDVVFCVDATGSMEWVLKEVKDRIDDIEQIVRSLVPIARFGVVAYRDFDDPDFTTRVQPLTYSTAKLYRFLNALQAKGGGDWYEAVDAGIEAAIEKSGWRMGARKIIIVVGDAPLRHGQLAHIKRLIEDFRRSAGTVSTLDVSDQANPHLLEAKLGRKVDLALYRNAPMQEFQVIAEAGGGDAATMDGENKLAKRLIRLIIGDQFATQMQALLDIM